MKKILYLLAIATMSLASCDVNDPIYETSNPDKGKITLTTDWTNRTTGIEIPTSYTARVGDLSATISGTTNEYPHLVPAGNYTLYVYNTADKISVSSTTATVATTAGVADPMPAWFFSGKATANIEDNKSYDITVTMKQEVRQLGITLTVTEGDPSHIASVTGTLTGIAGAWNFDTNTPTGNAVSVAPGFTRTGYKITASMRLLGIMTDASAMQELTLVVTFSDNTTQTIVKDLSSLLTGFNTDKHIPVDITADVQTRIEAGFSCTITDWAATTERPGTAN